MTAGFWALLGFEERSRWPDEYLIVAHPGLGVELHFWHDDTVDRWTNDVACYVRFDTPDEAVACHAGWSAPTSPSRRCSARRSTSRGGPWSSTSSTCTATSCASAASRPTELRTRPAGTLRAQWGMPPRHRIGPLRWSLVLAVAAATTACSADEPDGVTAPVVSPTSSTSSPSSPSTQHDDGVRLPQQHHVGHDRESLRRRDRSRRPVGRGLPARRVGAGDAARRGAAAAPARRPQPGRPRPRARGRAQRRGRPAGGRRLAATSPPTAASSSTSPRPGTTGSRG